MFKVLDFCQSLPISMSAWISFVGAGVVILSPRNCKNWIRGVGLFTTLLSVSVVIAHYVKYDIPLGGFQSVEGINNNWIPALGISFKAGVDGLSLPLLLLTGIIAFTGLLYSMNIEHMVKEFNVLYLTLIGGVYGVFFSLRLLAGWYMTVRTPAILMSLADCGTSLGLLHILCVCFPIR